MFISYYSAVIYLCWMALGVLCILVRENKRMRRSDKRRLYATYLLIALAAMAEWGGMILTSSPGVPHGVIRAVKCLDYVLTPLAGGALVWQIRTKARRQRPLMVVLAANTVFQIVCAFTDWMVVIHDGRYTHGKLYIVYVAIYLVVLALVAAEFITYGRTYRWQNRTSLYAIVGLVLIGIALQEVLGGDVRTAYVALTFGAALLFIHNAEFSSVRADEHIAQQEIQISTDALTGVFNRYAYSQALQELGNASLPGDLAVLSIDINGLKTVNDTLGHAAGDELICGAANCILKAVKGAGKCYRTGGDEFVVISHMDGNGTDAVLQRLEQAADAWHGKAVKELHMAAGYALAADYPYLTAEKLVVQADQAMYAAKGAYYSRAGRDRRKRAPSPVDREAAAVPAAASEERGKDAP